MVRRFVSMKYKLFLIWVLLILGPWISLRCQAQLLGTVVTPQGQPLAAASVFWASTSYGTVTNTDGSFSLPLPDRSGTYSLTISYTGYSTFQKNITLPLTTAQTLKITLYPKPEELKDVVVRPYEKADWTTWGKFFSELFLGTMPEAAQCRIENTRAIEFRHYRKSELLEAHASKPLVLVNKALGYRIQYVLEDFAYSFKEKKFQFAGFALFTEMQTNNKKQAARWEMARQKAYYGSQMHFMRALFANRLSEEGFEVRKLERVPNREKDSLRQLLRVQLQQALEQQKGKAEKGNVTISVRDTTSLSTKIGKLPDYILTLYDSILPRDSFALPQNDWQVLLHFANLLHVTYRKGEVEKVYMREVADDQKKALVPVSWLELVAGKTILVEASGAYFHPTDIFAYEYWGWRERMATMLPVDYEP